MKMLLTDEEYSFFMTSKELVKYKKWKSKGKPIPEKLKSELFRRYIALALTQTDKAIAKIQAKETSRTGRTVPKHLRGSHR